MRRSLSMASDSQLQLGDYVVIKVDAVFKRGWSCLVGVTGLDEESWASWYQTAKIISPLQVEVKILLTTLKMATSFN